MRPRVLPQRLLAGVALACVASVCAWTLFANHGADPLGVNLAGSPPVQTEIVATRGDKLVAAPGVNLAGSPAGQTEIVGTRGDKLVAASPRRPAVPDNYASLLDPHSFGFPAGTFVQSVPPQPDVRVAAAPQPAPTPQKAQQVASASPVASVAPSAASPPQLNLPQIHNALRDGMRASRAVADASAEQPNIFERLFGKPSPLTLAYAAPDDGGLAAGQNTGRYDRTTAVYDIAAHMVYMPDGTQLEAHSGYGSLLDDPRHPEAKDRGVTPPDVYDLVPREAMFHGVQALRLIPEDESKVYGRSGLLAHSFMLGPNGDSNGCVSFRNYDAFLRAYMHHEIKRLVVVSRLD